MNIFSKVKNINKKILLDNSFKYFSVLISFFVSLLLFIILGFILFKSILGFKIYGFKAILFSNKLNFDSQTDVSFWLPFAITLLTTFIALLIAVPIGIKTAIFIKFRVCRKYQKFLKILCEILSGIPSVVFGLFASKSLGLFLQSIGISAFSVLNGSIMLSFMLVPTIIAMTINSLDNVDKSLLINPIAMGLTKTTAIYKVYLKSARNGIIVAVILALGRGIGETTSLAMILQNQSSYNDVYNSGFFATLNSDLKTLSVIISTNMFGENSNENTRSLLFVFGFLLFIFIMIFNVIVMWISREKIGKKSKFNKFIDNFFSCLFFIPIKIFNGIEWIFFKERRLIKLTSLDSVIKYSRIRTEKYKLKNFYTYYKITLEILFFLIFISFLFWMLLMIFANGFIAISSGQSTIFSFSKNTTGQSFLNTVLIILIAILIGLPISVFSAIYLNEYAKNIHTKRSINFLLDSLGATPSILFGMFGVIFYLETLGLSNSGTKGYSLIAGALTVLLIIIPSFTRGIQQALKQVPNEIRFNALALAVPKFQIIRKIILPAALTSIVTTTVFAIGRILSETTPLFLTAGLTSSSTTALDRPGQTLTTRIYAQLFNPNIVEGENIMYEVAFITLILVLILVIVGNVLIPNNKIIFKWMQEKTLFVKMYFKKEMSILR